MKDFCTYIGEGFKTTSIGLLDRAKAGNQSAWERLMGLYAPLVDHWLAKAGLQHADVEDVRQEVFVALGRDIEKFRKGDTAGAFRRWLYGIAQNRLRVYWRKADALPLTTENDVLAVLAEPMPAHNDAPEELAILYRRSLDLMRQDFEEQTWQAFWRVVIENRAPGVVAAELKVTTNVVYIAKARVLARLREEFAALIEP